MIVSFPVPGYAVASMKRTSPPTAVYASPVATPGSAVRRRASAENLRAPSHSRTRSSSTLIFSVCPVATSVAAFRQSAAICRSRLRTPASRVYSEITSRSVLSGIVIRLFFRPCASICFGTRYRFAIPSFSSCV